LNRSLVSIFLRLWAGSGTEYIEDESKEITPHRICVDDKQGNRAKTYNDNDENQQYDEPGWETTLLDRRLCSR